MINYHESPFQGNAQFSLFMDLVQVVGCGSSKTPHFRIIQSSR